jgi:hypothetical protein
MAGVGGPLPEWWYVVVVVAFIIHPAPVGTEKREPSSPE